MGLFFKSLIILLIAASTPLVYRQFANDNTIKFMSSYYSNYKLIDQFLRQSANHLDSAKDYLPNSDQLKEVVDKFNQHFNALLESATKTSKQTDDTKSTKKEAPVREEKEAPKIRLCQCPDDDSSANVRLWSKQELANYDGNLGEPDVYLAFLGLVYNVTINAQHYASGADYNAFAGRDATRAFVTGNFTHDLNDDIHDLDESLYTHLESWASFYNNNYPIIGRIEGRFFDSRGCGTNELARVHQVFTKLEQDKANIREQESDFPDCNSEWNSDTKKGKVWCSTKSGGVQREWAGVPRIFNNGESQRCVCFNLDSPGAAELDKFMGVYPGCDPDAKECILAQ